MKYTRIDLFKQHLDRTLPDRPSNIYFIFMEDPFERRYLAKQLASLLSLPITNALDETFLETLESSSIFIDKGVLLCDELSTEDIPIRDQWILIITGKTPPLCFNKLNQLGVTLDLTQEKIWDKETRLKKWLIDHCNRSGKTLLFDGAIYLIQGVQASFALLYQEIEKILVYIGKEKTITISIIQTICHLDPKQNGWKIAEAVIWGGFISLGKIDIPSLIGPLRYQLELGLDLSQGKERLNIAKKKLEKIRRQKLAPSFYIYGLKKLFKLEIRLRLNSFNQILLFDHFRLHLNTRRNALYTT